MKSLSSRHTGRMMPVPGALRGEKQAQFSYLESCLRMRCTALGLISNDSLFPLNVHDFIWSKSAIYLHIGIYPPQLLLCNYQLLQDRGRVVQNIFLQKGVFFMMCSSTQFIAVLYMSCICYIYAVLYIYAVACLQQIQAIFLKSGPAYMDIMNVSIQS